MRLPLLFVFALSHFVLPANAATSIKFVAKTDGPGITVEGEATKSLLNLDFNKLESTTLTIDTMDLTTGMERRDKHMQEKVFGAKSPGECKIEFKVKSVSCPEDLKNAKNEIICDGIGALSIKGQKQDIKLKVAIDNKAKSLSTTTQVSLEEFKLKAPSFMGITVEDKVEISFKSSLN